MNTPAKELEQRLNQLKREVPTRGFERYPLLLNTLSDLPAELQSPAIPTLVNNEDIQTIIAFPPQIHQGKWNELRILLRRNDQTTEYNLLLQQEALGIWRAQWRQQDGR